jgi:hypothetical protein
MTPDQQEKACPEQQAGPAPKPNSDNIQGEYWRRCPRCGHELHNEKCMLIARAATIS